MRRDEASIRFTYFGVRFVQAWFDEPVSDPLPDIVIRRHSSAPPASGPVTPKKSIINDLTRPEEEIFAAFGKTCRYKIKRAETRDLAVCSYIPQPTEAELEEFISYYAEFARQKRLPLVSRKRFFAAAAAGRLRLSYAALGGRTIAGHSYVACGHYIRATYGGSPFRGEDNETRAAIGRANRLLNWHDMRVFRAEGFHYFDWGGLAEDESNSELKGINDFKREFGGTEMRSFDGFEAHSTLGRAVLASVNLARAMRSAFRGRRI